MFVVPEERRAVHPGDRFGRRVVLGATFMLPSRSGRLNQFCVTKCDCGVTGIADVASMRSKRALSCGCAGRESPSCGNYRHGGRATRLYRIWAGMLMRCTNPNLKSFPRYGGRGILVCDEWRSFRSFQEWSILAGYRDDLTIERIDTNGNYEPANCTWVTFAEQNINKRNNRLLVAFGETKTMKEWSRDVRCAVAYSVLSSRIQSGWNHERSIVTPSAKSQTKPGGKLCSVH